LQKQIALVVLVLRQVASPALMNDIYNNRVYFALA
jgi:hypothetical protein